MRTQSVSSRSVIATSVRSAAGRFGAAVVLVTLAAGQAWAQATPDRENGRYTFSQNADGLLRLDSRTGTVSICKRSAAGWACFATPDERDAFDKEIGRLQTENIRLKEQLAKREVAEPGAKTSEALPKADSLKPPDQAEAKPDAGKGNHIELPLPDDKDIDRVVSFLERAWRRLVEAANRMQRDVTGKI
jgi:hypothetical protein